MKNKFSFLAAFVLLFAVVQSKKFLRCEFARALSSSGVQRELISNCKQGAVLLMMMKF
jgi:hypothetical protein